MLRHRWYGVGLGSLGLMVGCGKTAPEPASVKTETVSAVSQSRVAGSDENSSDPSATKDGNPRVAAIDRSATASTETRPEIRKAQTAYDKLVKAHRDEDPESWIAADAELHQMGKAAATVLAKGLSDSDRGTRELAAMMLAKLGPDATVAEKELVAALNDKSPLVRANAASALSLLGVHSEKLVPVLMALLEEGSVSIRTISVYSLGNIGTPAKAAVPKLIELTEEENADLKMAAIVSLGNLGAAAKTAVASLEALKKDESEMVRTAANEALARISTSVEEPAATVEPAPAIRRANALRDDDAATAENGDEPNLPSRAERKEDAAPSKPISTQITEEKPTESKPSGPRLTGPQLPPPN